MANLDLTPQDVQVLGAILQSAKVGAEMELKMIGLPDERRRFLNEMISVCNKLLFSFQMAMTQVQTPDGGLKIEETDD